MKQFMEFCDDILYEFDGQLSINEIKSMTYKELGYLRAHRRKHHPREAEMVTKSLLGAATK